MSLEQAPVTSASRPPAAPYAAWLVAPLALVCLGAKVHKLTLVSGDVTAALAATFFDVAFLVGFGLLVWFALHAARGALLGLTRVALHALTLMLAALCFVEHGYWLATGTLLDAYTLSYALSRLSDFGAMLRAEMGFGTLLGLIALVAAQALPPLMARRDRSRARAPTRPRRAALLLASLAAAPACTGVAWWAIDLAPGLRPLAPNVVIAFAADALASDPPLSPPAAPTPTFTDVVLGQGPRAVPDGPPPDVLVVVLESVRASATTLHAPALDTTPFLASLARRGAMVETAWTSVTHTSKALVSILCGIEPSLAPPIQEAEATGLPVSCLPRLLGDRGYATAFMQTATEAFENRRQLVDNMGFGTFLSKESIPQGEHEQVNHFGWEDEALLDPALAFVAERRRQGRPWLLTLLTVATHHPYRTPADFPRRHAAQGELGAYLDATAYLDAFLAELHRRLLELGALERTLVVVVGDHGQAFGEHGVRQHNAAIYEEGLHVPLVLAGPGISPATRITGLRHIGDIAPTVLEWLGTPVASGLGGKSLLSTGGHERLFASCWLRDRCMAVRDQRHKLVWHFDQRPPERFDLIADPRELEDLTLTADPGITGPLESDLLVWKANLDRRWADFLARGLDQYVRATPPAVGRPLDLRFSAPATTSAAARPLARLIGIDPPPVRVPSGQPIPITLHYEVLGALPPYVPFTYLLGQSRGALPSFDAGHAVVQGRHPPSAWRPGTFVSDAFEIAPATPLPPGQYGLMVGFVSTATTDTGPAARAVIDAASAARLAPGVRVDPERFVHLTTFEVLPRSAAGSRP